MDQLLQSIDVARARRELDERGCFLIENVFSEDFCRSAMAFIDENEKDTSTEVNYGGTEIRVWDSQKKNALLGEFFERSQDVLKELFSETPKPQTLLAIRNLPTGDEARLQQGRWHIDSFFKQMKVFVFLTPTTDESGPFEFIPASHKTSFKIKMLFRGLYLRWRDLLGRTRTYQRIEDGHIERLGEAGYRPQPVLCKAGTVMIVNTSAIHRARPCLRGSRYALTSYFQ